MPLKLLVIWIVGALAACSVEPVTFRLPPVAIGGTVTGLAGTGLVLTNNGGDDLPISANGTFVFTTPLPRGASYALAVKNQPASPPQECSITNGSGTAGDTDVTDVQVSCRTTAFTIGGTVTGLAGQGLVLQNNGGDTLPLGADGAFTFPTPIPTGESYDVRVVAQPAGPTQVCTVTGGEGTVGDADVTDVAVTCVTSKFTISGTVTGLAGAGLVLQNNGADDLAISANGTFSFPAQIASGATFAVTVRTQPSTPAQTCTVAGGTGTVGGGDVTSVAINCATNRYMIGGTISGLAGTVVLRNNGGDDLSVTSNGTFAFATTVLSGATYNVTVRTQPTNPWQTCTVTAGSGTVTNADITSVVVTCATNQYSIGGTLSGLAAGNSITLRNSGGNDLVRTASGSFTFSAAVPSGQPYAVTVVANPTSPISQTCTVANGTGIVAGSNVTNVQVTCTTNAFTIGGTVSGLGAAGLVLQNNGGGDLAISANGPFTFAAPVPSGGAYSVTVKTQPTGEVCSITGGSGTVAASNVTSVQVTCTNRPWPPSLFPIAVPGATVGAGDLTLDGNGDLLVTLPLARAIVRVGRVTGAQSTVATGVGSSNLFGVAYRAANDMIYANSASEIFAVTPGGTVTPLATVSQLNAITIAPPSFGSFGGFIIGVTQSGGVVAVNPTTGAVTSITTAASPASDLAFAPDGTLYISGANSVRTVTAAGGVTPFVTTFSSADGIAITPDGGRMFIADSGTDTVSQVTIPGAVVTSVGPADIDSGFAVGGLVAAPGGTLIVMTGESSLTLIAFPY